MGKNFRPDERWSTRRTAGPEEAKGRRNAVFHGSYEHALDEKGRTSLPVRFRDLMTERKESEVVVTKAIGEPCLWVYPRSHWNEVLAAIESRSSYADSTKLKYKLLANANDVPFDKVGRVLVPQKLRQLAGLDADVVWVGMDRRIELWSKAAWDRKQAELDEVPLNEATLDGLPL